MKLSLSILVFRLRVLHVDLNLQCWSWRGIMPYYAVRVGKNPGVYETWPECQTQVAGFSRPVFKKFDDEEDARQFVQGIDPPKIDKKEESKFYAVRCGKNPGVYNTWSECQAQINGWKRPVYKKFFKKEDALLFLENPSSLKRPFHTSTSDSIDEAPEKQANDEAPEKQAKLDLDSIDEAPQKQANDEAPQKEAKLDLDTAQRKKIKLLDDVPQAKQTSCDALVGDYTGEKFPDSEGTHVYTDGGCFFNGQNGARAGIGVYWSKDDPSNVAERLPGRPTNNRAEIYAAVKAVQQAKTKGITNLILHTDSQFLINGITKWIKGWKKRGWKLSTGKPVINQADFEDLDKELTGINVKWVYVKGHSGDSSNDAVDLLAKEGAKKPMS